MGGKKSDAFKNGFWIGYSIERLMPKKSLKPTLEMILEGMNQVNSSINNENVSSLKESGKKAFQNWHDPDESIEKEIKEVAILSYFNGGSTNLKNAVNVIIRNITLYVDLKKKPLIWLGCSEQEESVDFLNKAYHKTGSKEIKEDIITVISLHKGMSNCNLFLKRCCEKRRRR